MIKVDDDTDAPLVVNPIVLSASDGDWDGIVNLVAILVHVGGLPPR